MFPWKRSEGVEADPTPASAPIIELDDGPADAEEDFESIEYAGPPEEEFFVVTSEREQELIDLRLEVEKHVETIHALHAEVRGLLRKQEKAEDLHRKELGFKDRLLHQKEAEVRDAHKLARQAEEAAAIQTAAIAARLKEQTTALQQCEAQLGGVRQELRDARAAAERAEREAGAGWALQRRALEDRARAGGARAAELEEAVAALQAKLLSATQGSQYQLKRVEHFANCLAEVESRAEQERDQAMATRQQLQAAEDELQRLRAAELQAAEAEAATRRQLERSAAEAQRLEAARHQLQAEVERLAADNRRQNADLEEATCRTYELEAQLLELEACRDRDRSLAARLRAEHERLEGELQGASDAEGQWEEKARAMQTQIAELSSALADASHSVCTLTRRLTAVEDERQGWLTQQHDSKAEHTRALHAATQQLQQTLAARTAEWQEKERALQAQLLSLRATSQEREGQAGAQQRLIEAQLTAAQQRIADLTAQVERCQAEGAARAAELERQLQAARLQLAGHEEEAAVLALGHQQEVERLEAEAAALQNKREVLENALVAMKGALATSTAQRDDASRQGKKLVSQAKAEGLQQVKEVEARLQGVIHQLQEQLREKSRSIWAHSRQMAELRDSTGVAKAELADVRAELDRQAADLKTAWAAAERKSEEAITFQQRLAAAEEAAKAAAARLDAAQADAARLRSQLAAAQAQASLCDEAQDRQAQLTQQVAELQAVLEEAGSAHKTLAAEHAAEAEGWHQNRAALAASEERLRAEADQLRAEGARAAGELAAARAALAAAAAEADTGARSLRALQQEREALRLQSKLDAETFKRESAEKDLMIASAELLADERLQEVEEARKELERVRERLDTKGARLAAAERALAELKAPAEKRAAAVAAAAAAAKPTKPNADIVAVLAEHPNSVPLRCTRDPASADLPPLDKSRFVAPKTMTLSGFTNHVRQKLHLAAGTPLTITVESDVMPLVSMRLGDIYEQCKKADGYLHVRYGHQ